MTEQITRLYIEIRDEANYDYNYFYFPVGMPLPQRGDPLEINGHKYEVISLMWSFYSNDETWVDNYFQKVDTASVIIYVNRCD